MLTDGITWQKKILHYMQNHQSIEYEYRKKGQLFFHQVLQRKIIKIQEILIPLDQKKTQWIEKKRNSKSMPSTSGSILTDSEL